VNQENAHEREGDASRIPPPTLCTGVQRVLLAVLAGLCLVLAVVGAILPGVPSTVFVLMAAWAAARSSPRLHAWLYRSTLFGPGLRHWHDGRKVSRQSKRMAAISMALCVVILCWTPGVRHWATWLAMVCMATVLGWLWRRPEPS